MNNWLIEISNKKIPVEIIMEIIKFIPKSQSYIAINETVKLFKILFSKYYKNIKVYLLWYFRSTNYLNSKNHMEFVNSIWDDINNIKNIDNDINTNIINYYSYLIISSLELRQKYIDKYIETINKEIDFNDININNEINEIYSIFMYEIPNLFNHFCINCNFNTKNKLIFALGCYYYLTGVSNDGVSFNLNYIKFHPIPF